MNLLVMVFDNSAVAHNARRAVRDLERQMFVAVEDAVVISRDAAGRSIVENEMEGDVSTGARVGGLAGLLIGLGAPVLGLALGAAGGALRAVLEPFGGQAIQTRVDPELAEQLRDVL
jgi:uncharacterized membrane protein